MKIKEGTLSPPLLYNLKNMDNLSLIESFSEFKDEKLIDRVTLMVILEDVFRNTLKRKFGSDDWFGNIVFIKINFETNRVLFKEINDTTIEGWIIYKLTNETDNNLTIRQCIPSNSSNCNMSEDLGYFKSYRFIDRTTGIMRDISEANGSRVIHSEYQCNKTENLF